MEEYLIRALKDDVGDLQLINVIRIITGRPMLHSGCSGEDHHGAKKVAARLAKEAAISKSVSSEEDEVNEDIEIDEIISSYIKKD